MENESQNATLINLIRNAKNPTQALLDAIQILTDCLRQDESYPAQAVSSRREHD